MDKFRLIAVTLPGAIEHEADHIVSLLEAGFDRVHIRKPDFRTDEMERLLDTIPAVWHSRLTLHDHFMLARHYNTGVQTNRRNPDAPCGVCPASHSCHSLSEAALYRNRDYVTLSPVFDSISKTGYTAAKGLIEAVKGADRSLLPPLIALGGVRFRTLGLLRHSGFAGAAMSGEIWNNTIDYTIRNLKALCCNS